SRYASSIDAVSRGAGAVPPSARSRETTESVRNRDHSASKSEMTAVTASRTCVGSGASVTISHRVPMASKSQTLTPPPGSHRRLCDRGLFLDPDDRLIEAAAGQRGSRDPVDLKVVQL